jgi:hypothetical protein
MLSLVPSNRPSRARFPLLPWGGKSMSSNSQGFSEVYKIEQLLKPLKATSDFLEGENAAMGCRLKAQFRHA